MKPGKVNTLIIIGIAAGLILTHGCGSSNNIYGGITPGNDNTSGVTITNEVGSPAEMNVGDIMMAKFGSSGEAVFDFEGVDTASQYFLTVGSLDYVFGTHSVSIESSLSDIIRRAFGHEAYEDEEWESLSPIDVFHQRVDDVGLALALDANEEVAESSYVTSKSSGFDPALNVGDTEELRVLNSLTSMSSYTTVTARVQCLTDNVVFYVDTEVESVNPNDLSKKDIQMLCENFHDQVDMERDLFGEESDMNGDGKVAVLLTPQVNRLGAMGGGIITGFFLASDLYALSGTNPVSNEMEILYTLVPDSVGNYGTVIPKTFAIENLLTAVIPHELQHLISYNLHVFEGGGTPEVSFLNEALSHWVENKVGYGQENYSRVGVFLDSPTSYRLVASGSPNLGERGSSYLFMQFLYEQHPSPDDFIWALYHGGITGVANIEAAFNGTEENFDQFGEFFMRWMTALAMTNRGLSADPRYVYQPRTYNSETERWQGVCLICEADDGRGTILTGPSMFEYSGGDSFSLKSSTVQFYNISSPPDVISFSGDSSGTFGAVLLRKQ